MQSRAWRRRSTRIEGGCHRILLRDGMRRYQRTGKSVIDRHSPRATVAALKRAHWIAADAESPNEANTLD